MNATPRAAQQPQANDGLTAAVAAYLLWGFMPLYFKWVVTVPALEMLAHRVVWAVPFGLAIVIVRRQLGELVGILRKPSTLAWLCLSATVIALNWITYILAVQREQVFQASLGYYINPLMYVLVGVMFFGERLGRPQWLAVLLAAAGVTVLTVSGGQVPWLALGLAVSFTVYGVVRKQVAVGAMPGLLIETLLLAPLAVGYLYWLVSSEQLVFLNTATNQNIGLMLGGPLTVLPLLFFAVAARRLTLSAIAFLQFMAPTIQFLLGVYFGEPITPATAICFALIWCGVALFAWDALGRWRSARQVPQNVR
ncbi:MAG: EamA family transporter RarD [Pseudomonadota bacterium]